MATSLDELAKIIKEQNQAMILKKSVAELSIQLKQLDRDSNDNSRALLDEFRAAVKALKDPDITPEEREQTEKVIETIKTTAETEEQRRETEAIYKKQYTVLGRISEGISNLAGNLLGTVKERSSSILGLLAGAALFFLSPEQLASLITVFKNFFTDIWNYLKTIDWNAIKETIISYARQAWKFLSDTGLVIYNIFKDIIEGDFQSAKNLLMDNLGSVAGLLFGAALLLAPNATINGLLGSAKLLMNSVMFIAGLLPSLATITTAFGVAWAAIVSGIETIGIYSMYAAEAIGIGGLGAAASFAVVAAAVVAAIYSIYEAFQKGMELFDEGAGWGEILLGALLELTTAPIRWIKNIVAWVAEKLGFEDFSNALDDFDITEKILDMLWYVWDWINEKIGTLLSWLGIDIGPVASIEERQTARTAERAQRALERQKVELAPDSTVRSSEMMLNPDGTTSPYNPLIELPPITGSYGMTFDHSNAMLESAAVPSAPIIIGGGSTGSSRSNVNNVSTSSYTISNGWSADDFVRNDFINSTR